ncbi:hypothetical protein CANTEDRAFT_124807 [Yamadazyma tenuis ATCC 10573]|nr:uncharacterized protein CANTEDRAFT_124807 [Yamadazyma tenuis ATCC 10573]EGV61741.1 hypothetical protein CANTEDRAFT_124807 [Yamadazyma tenuis ATCC 10573]
MFSVKQFWMQIDPQFVEQFTSPVYPAISPRPDDVLFISQKDAVWWLHRVLFDFSIANEFNSEVVVLTEKEFNTNKSFHDWLAINETLEDFERNLPQALKPIIYKPSSNDPNDSYYPTIYYRDELAAMIALHMKLTKVSLYQGLLQKTNLNSPEVQGYLKQIPRNHAKLLAKDVIGILRTYDLNTYLWPINIHTIRYVSRYLHDDEYEYKELEFFMKRVIETCHFIFQSKKIIG